MLYPSSTSFASKLPALLLAAAVAPAMAATVFQHTGSTDPTTEGWAVLGPGTAVTSGPLANDNGTGLAAWFVNDASTAEGSALQYRAFPTAAQAADALAFGWQLTANLRVVNVPDTADDSVSVEYLAGTHRFDMRFGSQADGDPIVNFPGGPTFALEGGGSGYHLYSLVFDPTAGLADLFIDGVEHVSNFAGFAEVSSPEVAWGGRASAATGHGNYNLIQFVSFVPEPSTYALLLASGALVLVTRRWRWRWRV